jgi:sterol desaturase/sphingolipid hydroxylase (fatty acid hydroxylase superfamily)
MGAACALSDPAERSRRQPRVPAARVLALADLHHLRPNGNFSLYFTHWDRLMGTEHANYKQQIAEHYGLDKQE